MADELAWGGTFAPKMDKIAPGWDSPPPVYPGGKISLLQQQMMAANTYNNGWPNGMLGRFSFMKTLKMFMVGWLKLGLLLPLIMLGMSDGQGSWKLDTRMADGPNWETSPPSRLRAEKWPVKPDPSKSFGWGFA
jgi:hypothetical protein